MTPRRPILYRRKTATCTSRTLLFVLLASPIHYYNYNNIRPKYILVNGQTTSSSTSTSTSLLDEDLITRPGTAIDFEGCFSDLARADRDGDGYVKKNEYLNFVQEYGKRICFTSDELTLQQISVFITLSCLCRTQEGTASNCCLGDNAQISTAGALDSKAVRSANDNAYLTSVCRLTDATIDAKCPPIIAPKQLPPPISAPVEEDNWWKWLFLLLLLFLLCCCCVYKKRRDQQQEEETELAKVAPPIDPEQPQQPPAPILYDNAKQNLRNVGLPEDNVHPLAAEIAAMSAFDGQDQEDSDDEAPRRKRGGGVLPDDPDQELLQVIGAKRFPPSYPDQENIKLRPIPPKEYESDEWDQPGRDIQYPIDKDDISAGEVEHYEPDGGLDRPYRPSVQPIHVKKTWNRPKPEEPDEVDLRKHRIQSGLGEGEVWNKLDEASERSSRNHRDAIGAAFDWVVQSALGALGPLDSPTNHTTTTTTTRQQHQQKNNSIRRSNNKSKQQRMIYDDNYYHNGV